MTGVQTCALPILGIALLLFVATTSLVPLLPTAFISAGGEKLLAVTISPPVGVGSDAVLARTEQAETILGDDPDVELVQATIPGEGDTGVQTLQAAFTGRAPNSARMTVRLAPTTDLAAKTEALLASLASVATDGYSVTVEEAAGFAPGGFSVVVSGPDPAAIATASEALVPALATVEGLANVKSDLAEAAPLVSVAVDPVKAAMAQSSTAQIALAIRGILTGQELGTFTIDGVGAVPAILRIDPAAFGSIDALKAIPVGAGPAAGTLGSVADVRRVEAQGSVTRVDGAPAATIGEIGRAHV